MSENDMQRFPTVRVPMLIKIQQDIKKKEERKTLFPLRGEVQKPLPASYQHPSYEKSSSVNFDGSDSDSFDDDYEDPDASCDEADYESPSAENEDEDVDYEPPPTDVPIVINAHPSSTSNPVYVDKKVSGSTFSDPPNFPLRSVPPTFSTRGNTFPGVQSSSGQESHRIQKAPRSLAPSVDRTKKPTMGLPSQTNTEKPNSVSGKKESPKATTLPTVLRPPSKPDHLRKPPLPGQPSLGKPSFSRSHTDMDEEHVSQRTFPHSSNTFPTTSPKPSLRHVISGSTSLPITDITGGAQMSGGLSSSAYKQGYSSAEGIGNDRSSAQNTFNNVSQQLNEDLYSQQWYFGHMSRKDADIALRSMNQDGTFLVRDCSQHSVSQPYVLMVLYKDKVYNVRIRFHQDTEVYLLGSGGQETFNSVSEIIDFFRSSPLLLIDGKDRGSKQHCKLTSVASRNFH
ncbi:lymphocyte cytosolic protein 2 isoform X2 [Hyperolius riggenbachi]